MRAGGPHPEIAVIIPCRNESVCIAKVVRDFRNAIPAAEVHVCDNDSDDDTAARAAAAGATVHGEPRRGKGNAIRRVFADIEADIYLLVDGDDTYDAASAARIIAKLERENLDMVVGVRQATADAAYRVGHRFGNAALTGLVGLFFGSRITDMLSGYRVFSRRFVKSFPALSTGFEVETELTVHALELKMPTGEVPTPYRERPPASVSKLNTYRDGWLILRMILLLVKEVRPLAFFSTLAGVLAAAAVLLAWPIFVVYAETGLVPRFPTAILSTGLMLLAFLSLACGAILDSVARGRREIKRLRYLAVPRRAYSGSRSEATEARDVWRAVIPPP
jgi:glycosyltransferase involved in cell wall biosynthesis